MESDASVTRREFVKLAAATSIAVGAGSLAWAAEKQGGMPYRTLGRTGEKVSAIGLGGYHIGKQADEQGSIRLIRSDEPADFDGDHRDRHDGDSRASPGCAHIHPVEQGTVARLLARTADAAAAGKYELFKTSSRYDGTAHNPQWAGLRSKSPPRGRLSRR